MGVVAAVAVVVMACCGAVRSTDPWMWSIPAVLTMGVGLVIQRRPGWTRPRDSFHDKLFGGVLLLSGALLAFAVPGLIPNRHDVNPGAAGVAMLLMSLYWPDPSGLGFSVAGSFVFFLAAESPSVEPGWVVPLVAAGAVAAMATARIYLARWPRFGTERRSTGHLARDAAIVVAVALALGALLATIVPPPPAQSSGRSTDLEERFGESGAQGGPGAGQSSGSSIDPLGLHVAFTPGLSRPYGGDEVVLEVKAASPDVWRSTTYSDWFAGRWTVAGPTDPDQVDSRARRNLTVRPGPGDVVDPSDVFPQTMTIKTDRAQSLAGAPVVTRASAPSGSYILDYGGVLIEGPIMTRGSTYAVESSRLRPDAAALRDVPSGDVPEDLRPFTRLAPDTDPRIEDLALRVTADLPTAYDKALAVDQWLSTNTVATSSDLPSATGPNVLSDFLFRHVAGDSTVKATATAVLLRAAGVPARFAIGFRPGEQAGRGKPFVVRAKDATAWAEVWYPGFGWQRFDPAGALVQVRQVPKQQSIWERIWNLAKVLWPLLLLVVVAPVVWLLVGRARRRRAWESQPWVVRYYDRLVTAGAKRDRPRHPDETPLEYASALAHSALADERLEEVGNIVTRAAYSGHDPAPADQRWAEEVLDEALAAAPKR